MATFLELGIDTDIVDVLSSRGITEAFPIQEQTIPLALTGQDIIGQAKTGTGKTFGFGLPLLQRLGAAPSHGVKALVVVPTRELAVQVFEDLALAASKREVTVAAIYGGKSYDEQIAQLQAGAQIVVGTPGRLLDLAGQRLLSLSEVSEMVLDEADKMLDLGFLADIEKLFAQLPAVRHTMLFSATMPGTIVALARRFMSQPVHIRATDPDEGAAQANIEHIVYRAHSLDKDEVIGRILQATGRGKTVIFMRTKRAAAKLQDELRERGFAAAAVHGDLNQEQRERSMASFKSGKKEILIATDVAARGIDVDDVTHVINHTVPDDEKTYLHRVGRTGRAGRTGIAVTFVDWDDMHKWALINTALDFGVPEPVETYSSSPHLFADLNIPEGTKGRIAAPSADTSSRNDRNANSRQSRGAANSAEDSREARSRSTRSRKRTVRRPGHDAAKDQQPAQSNSSAAPSDSVRSSGEPNHAATSAEQASPAGERTRPRRRRKHISGDSSVESPTTHETQE